MIKKLPHKIADYLNNYAFTKWKLEWNEVHEIDIVVVVPAIGEFENIKNLLSSLITNSKSSFQSSLIIFVINNPASADIEIRNDNEHTIHYLSSIIQKNIDDELSKKIINSGLQIGFINASSNGNELDDTKAGVGLARKIGMDMALSVFDYNRNDHKIIVSLDADCIVEDNYLFEVYNFFSTKNFSAAVVDFEHIIPDDEQMKRGMLSYEIFLRHYVAGLIYAKSPFALHTVGSTIICTDEAYVKIGGMNTRKAAEDFYFLQKLAKQYSIGRIISTKVKPSARVSSRVPFGTGRSMKDFLFHKKDILVYDPEVYVILKKWLKIFNSNLSKSPYVILEKAKKIHPELYNFLNARGFKSNWQKILENTKSSNQLEYQRKNWFDAFETLKLLHHLRDNSYPMIDIVMGTEKLFNVSGHWPKFDPRSRKINEAELLEFYLDELKKLENNFN